MTAAVAPGGLVAEQFAIVALIGQGGMASVCSATDTRLGRPVALKVLARDVAEALGAARFLFVKGSHRSQLVVRVPVASPPTPR